MKQISNYLLFFFIPLLFMTGVIAQNPPPCTPYSYDCSYYSCSRYGTRCSVSYKTPTPAIIGIDHLRPGGFQWSHPDNNTSNDICRGSNGVARNCNAGTSTYLSSVLPGIDTDICRWSNNRSIPSQVMCRWKDGSCGLVCVQRTRVVRTCTGCR